VRQTDRTAKDRVQPLRQGGKVKSLGLGIKGSKFSWARVPIILLCLSVSVCPCVSVCLSMWLPPSGAAPQHLLLRSPTGARVRALPNIVKHATVVAGTRTLGGYDWLLDPSAAARGWLSPHHGRCQLPTGMKHDFVLYIYALWPTRGQCRVWMGLAILQRNNISRGMVVARLSSGPANPSIVRRHFNVRHCCFPDIPSFYVYSSVLPHGLIRSIIKMTTPTSYAQYTSHSLCTSSRSVEAYVHYSIMYEHTTDQLCEATGSLTGKLPVRPAHTMRSTSHNASIASRRSMAPMSRLLLDASTAAYTLGLASG
jgi:hypothetical protein